MSSPRMNPSAVRRPLIRPRLYLGHAISIGPGKIDLLREIQVQGSISAAARALDIPYKRAWQLLDTLSALPLPVVETSIGGRSGGGARLTAYGAALIAAYDALESRLNAAAETELATLQRLVEADPRELAAQFTEHRS